MMKKTSQTEQLYQWQKKVVNSYDGSGTAKAVTGAGKSLVGLKIAERYSGKILVTAPTNAILDQWRILFKDIKNKDFILFNTLYKKQIKNVDLLIVDECHRSVSPEFIKLYDNVDYQNILGLSATPNKEAINKCGPLLCDVGYDEANVCPFIVKFHGINLKYNEEIEYRRLSYGIGKLLQHNNLSKKEKEILNTLILKRRNIVYNAEQRIPYTVKLIKHNWSKNKKILVICQRKSQADKISKQLTYIPHIVYHSSRLDDLEKYRKGDVQVCISVGMLKEGFDDPNTDCGIIASTTLSESFNIQSIGRIIRHKPEKFAEIHILLANATSDTKTLNYSGNYDFELINIKLPNTPELTDAYYSGKKYSFLANDIWEKTKDGRIFMQAHDITNLLRKLKPSGGSFMISDNGVYTKVDNKIIKVTDDVPKFIPIIKKENKNITFEEIMESWK